MPNKVNKQFRLFLEARRTCDLQCGVLGAPLRPRSTEYWPTISKLDNQRDIETTNQTHKKVINTRPQGEFSSELILITIPTINNFVSE